MSTNKNEEVFDPDKMDCCIEIVNCELENPPKELMEKLIGKPISDCEIFLNQKNN